MKVLVAGAAGALGKPLVGKLLEAGHEVAGTTRSRADEVSALGAKPIVMDALDPFSTKRALEEASPEAVIHAVTRIPHAAVVTPRRMAVNDRLRVEGTQNLLEACRGAGVNRILGQSITFAFRGRSEQSMKPLHQMAAFQRSVDAVLSLEKQIFEVGGIVLRFGFFYGPGTAISEQWPKALKRRTLPIVGKGTGWWSFIHIEDAAAATVAALERGLPGEVYNVCDDEPIIARDALAVVASATGGRKPFRIPVGPTYAMHYFNQATGASNTKARTELTWSPQYPSFKEGFPTTV